MAARAALMLLIYLPQSILWRSMAELLGFCCWLVAVISYFCLLSYETTLFFHKDGGKLCISRGLVAEAVAIYIEIGPNIEMF